MAKKRWYSINYDGFNSWDDFGLTINSKTIGIPSKLKSRVRLPNSNRFVDYANIFGEFYNERELTYVFNVVGSTKEDMNIDKTDVLNWLMPGLQKRLEDSAIEDYYFMGEVSEAPEFSEVKGHGLLTVKFTCYPFEIATKEEGNDVWDAFNFKTGVAQEVAFDVTTIRKELIINNSATEIQPTIKVDGDITVTIGVDSNHFTIGTYTDSAVMLPMGEFYVSLIGNGTIRFLFYREVI